MIAVTAVLVALAVALAAYAIAVRGRRHDDAPDVGTVSDRWLMTHRIER
jgi:hypothetical protein